MRFPEGRRLEDYCESPPDSELPPLDRADSIAWNVNQREWMEDGFLVLPGILPAPLMDAYCRVREPLGPAGFGVGHPYMTCPELLALATYRPVTMVIEDLIGEACGLHLNLTGWVTTERDWHQDDYLNHAGMNAHYAAAWFALEDISPESGPFQCVPGSHRWPLFRRDKLMECLDYRERRDPMWPKLTEAYVAGLFAEKMARENARVFTYLPSRGDVLIWHGRLCHRGSKARVPGTPRKALINHYSALSRRVDMPNPAMTAERSWYFVF